MVRTRTVSGEALWSCR